MNVRSQRNIAKSILKVGRNKVWIDPEKISEIQESITKNDIRKHISEGSITARPIIGTSTARSKKIKLQKKKGQMTGQGKRKGTKKARIPSKRVWITKIRALRKELNNLKSKDKIKTSEYRHLYLKSSSGVFKDKSSLHLYIKKMRQ
ncbi:MAG: 50S ribosomal protein L19e [Candidatus Aenigmarchaeota archaeon]|nr:50S ribosomal protein L19e [Candidatus Aenigmarchaeota archaeon]